MSSPPISLLKSRENLQALFSDRSSQLIKYETFDRILSVIWNRLRQTFQFHTGSAPVSKYIINLHDPNYFHNQFIFTDENVLELINILKREYPRVDFTYNQTSGYDGKIIERIIIMDWS